MANKKHSWIYRLFNDMYEVSLSFDTDADKPAKTEKYMLKHINKISTTYLKGIDEDGLKVEFKSVKPFDYKIRKLY
jgi:hypothetical protein